MGWLLNIGNPIKALFGGIKSLVTTDKDRLDNLKEVAKLDNGITSKLIDLQIELAKSGNWYTKSVRPTIAYTFLFLFVQSKFDFGINFTSEDYLLFRDIFGFYFILRTSEKVVNVVSGLFKKGK